MVGLIPLCATTTLGTDTLGRLPDFADRVGWFLADEPRYRGVVDSERLVRVLATMLSEVEFHSPHGLRALSRRQTC